MSIRCILLLFPFVAFSQIKPDKKSYLPVFENMLEVELFGKGLLGSVGYERLVKIKNRRYETASVGVFLILNPDNATNHFFWALPIGYQFIGSQKQWQWEMGMAMTTTAINYEKYIYFIATPKFGLRYQEEYSRWVLKLYLSPLVSILRVNTGQLKYSVNEESFFPDLPFYSTPYFPSLGIGIGYGLF